MLDAETQTRLREFLETVIGCLERQGTSFMDMKPQNIGVYEDGRGTHFRLIDVDSLGVGAYTYGWTLVCGTQYTPGIFEGAIEKAEENDLDPPISRDEYLFASTLFSAMEVAAVACLPRNQVSAFKERMVGRTDMNLKLDKVVGILDGNEQMRQLFEQDRPKIKTAIDNIRRVVSVVGADGFLKVG